MGDIWFFFGPICKALECFCPTLAVDSLLDMGECDVDLQCGCPIYTRVDNVMNTNQVSCHEQSNKAYYMAITQFYMGMKSQKRASRHAIALFLLSTNITILLFMSGT
jgi:hypothetical protein